MIAAVCLNEVSALPFSPGKRIVPVLVVFSVKTRVDVGAFGNFITVGLRYLEFMRLRQRFHCDDKRNVVR